MRKARVNEHRCQIFFQKIHKVSFFKKEVYFTMKILFQKLIFHGKLSIQRPIGFRHPAAVCRLPRGSRLSAFGKRPGYRAWGIGANVRISTR